MTERTEITCVTHRSTTGFEYWRGWIANYNSAPDKRHVIHAFCWGECFQGSPQGKHPFSMHLLHAAPFKGLVLCSLASVCPSLLWEHPTFAQEHKLKEAVAIAAHVCEEEEVKPGQFLFRRKLHNVVWTVSCFKWKAKIRFFSGTYHKGNEILLQQLLS